MESNWNSLDSIKKFAVRLIWKSRKYSKNSLKINSNLILSIQLQLWMGWNQIFRKLDSFENHSIRYENLTIRLFQDMKKYSKNSLKINSKFVQFNSDTALPLIWAKNIQTTVTKMVPKTLPQIFNSSYFELIFSIFKHVQVNIPRN